MQADIFAKRRKDNLIFFSLLGLITIASIIVTEYDVVKGFTSVFKAAVWAVANFYPNAKAMAKLPDILPKLQETILMSISSTTFAAIFSIPFALFGSKVTKINNILGSVSRLIASIFRNVPIVAWAMVLLFSFGQSAMTGYLALFFTSFGFLVRAFIETMDETSTSSVEALRASGASYLQTIFQAVLPSAAPQMISWVLYTIETNIRSATLVGILTGTGIGFSFELYYKSMNYNAASLVVLVVVIVVFAVEFISNYVRRVII
ncbi:MAG: ABC transporter permease subunit [Clostridia bacterium]|nr:ABC transporter permease subunit [Clostridia bacterium]